MKKNIFILIFFLSVSFINAQSAKEMLAEIEGKYELDNNRNVTFSRIIDVPNLSKNEIYQRALNYFTYNYNSGKSVIQSQDKEIGTIVGKGIFNKVHVGHSVVTTRLDALHILRIDSKDGKARVIITLTQYEKTISGGNSPNKYYKEDISNEYPINPKGRQKTIMAKAFYKTYQIAQSTLNSVEKALIEGSTSSKIENSDW